MNKKSSLLLLPLIALSLCSCVDTEELYAGNAYVSSEFTDNAYTVYHPRIEEAKDRIVSAKVLQNEKTGYFNGSGVYTSPSTCAGYGQAKEWHPKWFENPDETPLYWGNEPGKSDVTSHSVGTWADPSPLYGVIYSQTKKLSRNYPKFARGYLSKLYNGQIKCDSWSYYAMVLTKPTGYGQMFPYELSKAEYFAFSLRGASDSPGGTGRVATYDINVTFYKYGQGNVVEGHRVTMKSVSLNVNGGSNNTALVGFTFEDADYDPWGTIGMSVDWSLVNDPNGASSDFSSTEGYHIGLCLYEVLFPDSERN